MGDMNDVTERSTEEQEAGADTRTPPRVSLLAGVGLALVFAGAAFLSGVHIGSDTRLEANISSLFAAPQAADERADLSRFWRVWELLDERFVSPNEPDPKTTEERIDGAIRGLVETYGDPYTVYLPPEDAALFEEDIAGNFEGVGMEIGQRDGRLTIIAPLPNTPAERAGVRSGDVIIRIDGESTEGMSVDAAVKRIRGEKGTEVALTLLREGNSELLEVPIVRDTINIPTIATDDHGDVFVIRLFNFSAMAEARLQQALREYVESGDRKLVLDLRGNPGGYLQSAVNIASFFLPTGKVVVREHFGDGRNERVYRSTGKLLGQHAPTDMVVLIDGGSASASEILAGALGEHGVATLIGAQTFGKGSVQELLSLGGGASLKVTVARWLTPDGNSISDGGLTPDIEIPADSENLDADVQLEAALDYLRAR